ncbi:MAG: hypothetical protein CMH81_00140 [Nitrospiraceae bacterium]|nr:hypothetical protein [Nitrospiraceae bacterium]|tara:strand:+ start:1970 stop:2242 length:273 start_codon:yes stop_codon:yes gene_type:complete
MTFNIKAFALACGIFWGLGLFILTWWIIFFEPHVIGEKTFIGYVYRGYTISPLGSIIGLMWAFVDGIVGGAIFAWLYNLISRRVDQKPCC